MLRCKCGQPSDGWPGDKAGEELCQMCWEEYCDRAFWAQFDTPEVQR